MIDQLIVTARILPTVGAPEGQSDGYIDGQPAFYRIMSLSKLHHKSDAKCNIGTMISKQVFPLLLGKIGGWTDRLTKPLVELPGCD